MDPEVSQTGEAYDYAGGDPTSAIDPDGLSWIIALPWDQAADTSEFDFRKELHPILGITNPHVRSEVQRDKYILQNKPTPNVNIACHPKDNSNKPDAKCEQFSVHGATWWFRYNNRGPCQRSTSPINFCPTIGLVLAIHNSNDQGPGMNIVLMIETNHDAEVFKAIYENDRKQINKALESEVCPVRELDSLGFPFLKYWHDIPGTNDNSCSANGG